MESARWTKSFAKREDNVPRQDQRANVAAFQSGALSSGRPLRQRYIPELLPLYQHDVDVTTLPEQSKALYKRAPQSSARGCQFPGPTDQPAHASASQTTPKQPMSDSHDAASARGRRMRDARLACRNSLRPQNDWLRLSALKPIEMHFDSSPETQQPYRRRERTPTFHRSTLRGGMRHGRSQTIRTSSLSDRTNSSPLSRYPVAKKRPTRFEEHTPRREARDCFESNETVAAHGDTRALTPVQISNDRPVSADADFQVRIGTDAFFSQTLPSRLSATQATTHLHNFSPASSLLSGETMLLDDRPEEAAHELSTFPTSSINSFACRTEEIRRTSSVEPKLNTSELEFHWAPNFNNTVMVPPFAVSMTNAAEPDEALHRHGEILDSSDQHRQYHGRDHRVTGSPPGRRLRPERRIDDRRSEVAYKEDERSWQRLSQVRNHVRSQPSLRVSGPRKPQLTAASEEKDHTEGIAAPGNADRQVFESLADEEGFAEDDRKADHDPKNMSASAKPRVLPKTLEKSFDDSSQATMDDEDMWRRFVIGDESDDEADLAGIDGRQDKPLRILHEGLSSEIEDTSILSSSDHDSGRAAVATSTHPAASRPRTHATMSLPEDSESIWNSSLVDRQAQASVIAQASTAYQDFLDDDTRSSSTDTKWCRGKPDVTTYWKRLRTGRVPQEPATKNLSRFKPAQEGTH